jgi:hypothetical protein
MIEDLCKAIKGMIEGLLIGTTTADLIAMKDLKAIECLKIEDLITSWTILWYQVGRDHNKIASKSERRGQLCR